MPDRHTEIAKIEMAPSPKRKIQRFNAEHFYFFKSSKESSSVINFSSSSGEKEENITVVASNRTSRTAVFGRTPVNQTSPSERKKKGRKGIDWPTTQKGVWAITRHKKCKSCSKIISRVRFISSIVLTEEPVFFRRINYYREA
jgi:hypothetical protein